ncbi:hypothetical protein [Microvirga mediterraneensis]|uniref:Uncharacterized protein n=1 Tax=Microvirga mediterraneensis TaxID=2754695 RepID=A0A838BMR4_9HYPH|nr:hypothetical protein [Microvirga mediterraneensis]MBA1156720.1 hypothetical protein [Microvirga mediterraneensis]
MRTLTILSVAGIVSIAGLAAAQAQSQPNPIQGTPGSLFPYAAPNEVQIINGVPCRTVLIGGSNVRVPVECAGQAPTGTFEPGTTGSIRIEDGGARSIGGRPLTGSPDALFPYAMPNEVQIINGVPCRTVLIGGSNVRVPIECIR